MLVIFHTLSTSLDKKNELIRLNYAAREETQKHNFTWEFLSNSFKFSTKFERVCSLEKFSSQRANDSFIDTNNDAILNQRL